ncbi:MAG: GDYXXLXY domain-containing protein [Cyanophyceae cyanobacterium]
MTKPNLAQSKFLISTRPQPHRALSKWRFWLPLLLQVGLIAAIPAQAFHILLSGRTVVLQTVPVDPYDLLRGYSQTLRYDVSRVDALKRLPGWNQAVQQLGSGSQLPSGSTLFVIVESPAASPTDTTAPQAWKPVGVSLQRPHELPNNRVALQGVVNRRWIDYGLETYYMPEDRREKINTEISQTREQAFVVEVKVNGRGKSVPVSLWVSDRHYRF